MCLKVKHFFIARLRIYGSRLNPNLTEKGL